MNSCQVPIDWVHNFDGCLYDWQTLLSGVLAVAAAVLGAIFLSRQIQQTEALNNAALQRRHNASRSVLPLALSGISGLLQSMASTIAEEIERINEPSDVGDDGTFAIMRLPRSKFDPLGLSPEHLAAVRDFVETLTRPSEVRHVAELTAQLQVLQARYNDFDFSQVCVADRLHALLLNVAVVGALNDAIFNYARAVDEGEFGIVGRLANGEAWDRVHTKLHGLVFSRPRLDMFSEEASTRIKWSKDNDVSPWLAKFER